MDTLCHDYQLDPEYMLDRPAGQRGGVYLYSIRQINGELVHELFILSRSGGRL